MGEFSNTSASKSSGHPHSLHHKTKMSVLLSPLPLLPKLVFIHRSHTRFVGVGTLGVAVVADLDACTRGILVLLSSPHSNQRPLSSRARFVCQQ